jgi:hypothetical protein
MSQRKVYEWVEILKGGRKSVDASSGRLSTATCVEVKEQNDYRVRDNRRISVDETASDMSTTHGKNRCKNGLRA